ncbi:MAG: hypothetical protein JNK48_05560 [Bryobacterales bacterium]|nr:hypothetical protein [Bryobacterales bacterium]
MMLRIALLLLAASASAQQRYTAERRDSLIVLTDHEDGVQATLAPSQGGELCGLRFRHNGQWIELLYKACDYTASEGWRGKAPLLWPATGATLAPGERAAGQRAGRYQVRGTDYSMPFHGFAQNMPWKADIVTAGRNEARALLSLNSTPETRKLYPFDWLLSVEYRLRDGRLFLVYNAGASQQNQGNMFFSIGNHITFRTPFLPGSGAAAMTMETPAGFQLAKDDRNLPTGKTVPNPYTGRVPLSRVPTGAAQSLGGYTSDPVIVLDDPNGLRLRMKHSAERWPAQPLVQFNLWGDAKAGYFSPEPWVGAQNSFHSRIGLVELKPGQAWRWTIEIQPSATARM